MNPGMMAVRNLFGCDLTCIEVILMSSSILHCKTRLFLFALLTDFSWRSPSSGVLSVLSIGICDRSSEF